ncbi:hypothetical protein [Tessaracoccus antarcticus]|uniref:Uncharacterized protein n=1 Tax=Tessaracoccus antarcticus TaxID=2479848 RepID=A0A3M0FWW1_9ACTN|nr:hypothetical protein [Tessaracoccus antarcticus]RMB57260.1 hypothetical protein EAX62_16115 [Tessaracoccus antarcticus]
MSVYAIPTPDECYSVMPYQFNKWPPESTVVRIPILGPAPFNTLAFVRTLAWIEEYTHSDDKLHRHTGTFSTPLYLRNYDRENPAQQQLQHSSTATISMMQISHTQKPFEDAGDNFVIAVDRISPELLIEPSGRVQITVEWASKSDNQFGTRHAQISSWILCYEPPTPATGLPVGTPAQMIMSLATVGVDHSVAASDLEDWLGDPETPYPAISQALLTLLSARHLARPVFLDVIVFNYEERASTPIAIDDVVLDTLKASLLEGSNNRHGTAVTSFEALLGPETGPSHSAGAADGNQS